MCYAREINESSQRRQQCFQLSSLLEQIIRSIDSTKIPGEQQNVDIEKPLNDDEFYEKTYEI